MKFPPPFLYAAAVLIGIVVHRAFPLAIGGGAWREWLALGLGLLCAALLATSIGRFWVSRTSILPMRPATVMIHRGPYRFTRNPMYVGMAILTCAFALFFNSWWPIVFLGPVLILIQRFVIGPEEQYLLRRFGAEYEAYTRQVRRWL